MSQPNLFDDAVRPRAHRLAAYRRDQGSARSQLSRGLGQRRSLELFAAQSGHLLSHAQGRPGANAGRHLAHHGQPPAVRAGRRHGSHLPGRSGRLRAARQLSTGDPQDRAQGNRRTGAGPAAAARAAGRRGAVRSATQATAAAVSAPHRVCHQSHRRGGPRFSRSLAPPLARDRRADRAGPRAGRRRGRRDRRGHRGRQSPGRIPQWPARSIAWSSAAAAAASKTCGPSTKKSSCGRSTPRGFRSSRPWGTRST